MDLGLIARYLVLRRQLRSRERWSPDRQRVHQPAALLDGAAVLAEIAQALEATGANVPGLTWVEVDAIPRTGAGKTAPHPHHRRTSI